MCPVLIFCDKVHAHHFNNQHFDLGASAIEEKIDHSPVQWILAHQIPHVPG